ncbi:MAG: phosphatase PAP2 family protein [Deltaproteobacteria bacterium]|nr:phosphatase PAP2 family protein [Deltaproteobacteria bacterium]
MDEALFRVLNGTYETADLWWGLFDNPSIIAIFVVGVAAASWFAGERRYLLPALIAVGICDLTCARVLKPTFDRARPCAVLDEVTMRPARGDSPCGSGRSMPSCHAANSAALAAALGSPALAAVSLATGLSRVATGQHWPSDVVAGWAMGAGVGMGLRYLFQRALGWR